MPDRQELILEPSECEGGCVPNHEKWRPEGHRGVRIKNRSGNEQKLSEITRGLLNPSPHNDEIILDDGEDWTGTVSKREGTYQYEDGCEAKATRTGTIDPS